MIAFKILTSIAILAFVGYLIHYFFKYKNVPKSLSETYYTMEHGYVFCILLIGMAAAIISPMLSVTKTSVQFLAFLCPTAIAFVGAAPCFKDEYEGKIHKIAAYVGAACGLLWVIFGVGLWWIILDYVAVIIYLGIVSKTFSSCKTFWLEMIAFGAVLTSLLIKVA